MLRKYINCYNLDTICRAGCMEKGHMSQAYMGERTLQRQRSKKSYNVRTLSNSGQSLFVAPKILQINSKKQCCFFFPMPTIFRQFSVCKSDASCWTQKPGNFGFIHFIKICTFYMHYTAPVPLSESKKQKYLSLQDRSVEVT